MSQAAYFPKSWLLSFDFLTFFITIHDGSGSISGSGTGAVMHSGSGSAKAKCYGSCGSSSGSCAGYTTLLVSISIYSSSRTSLGHNTNAASQGKGFSPYGT
jgi:hypothetical protein